MSAARKETGVRPLVVHREIEIDAPPERVWSYIATSEGYRRWSCPPAEPHTVVLEQWVGGRFEERMTVKGREYSGDGKVLEYEPPTKLVLSSRSTQGLLAPITTVITFSLTDLGGRTRVTVEETGFEQLAPERRAEKFRSFDQGWAHAMDELLGILVQELLPALGHLLIYQSAEMNAPADRVWWFLATEEGRRERDRRVGYSREHYESEIFEAREGGRWESVGTSAHSGDPYRQFGRILAYRPPRLLVLTLQEEGWPTETVVTYRLTEYFGNTRVSLIHSGFEKLPPDHREMTRKAYEIGRFKSLDRLRALVEGEEVEPHRPLYVRKEIDINAPVERVWWFVGTEEGNLTRHRAESGGAIEYVSELLEERVGGNYELRGRYEGRPFRIVGRILANDPPNLLALSWREVDDRGRGWPVDTLVRYRLIEEAGRTRLIVIHNGFEHLPAEYREISRNQYEAGRARGIEVIRLLAEGAAVPSP